MSTETPTPALTLGERIRLAADGPDVPAHTRSHLALLATDADTLTRVGERLVGALYEDGASAQMVRVAVPRDEVDKRCTLVLSKDGVTVQGPASATAPLTVPMPQFGYVKNVYASVSDGWEFVEAWYEMTQDEANMACEWADYRKHYGVGPDLSAAHQAFKAGWQAAKGQSHESVQS